MRKTRGFRGFPWLSMAFRQGQKPKVAGECCRDGQKSCPAFGRKVGRALPMAWRSMNWLLAEYFLQNHPRSRRCRCHAVQVREWYLVFCYSSHRLIWCGVDALQLRTYFFAPWRCHRSCSMFVCGTFESRDA